MRTRILLTNGLKTIDLFWLSHDDKDIYCGLSGFDSKSSYHASGKVHIDSNGLRNHLGWFAPLKDLKGQFHLKTISLTPSKTFFDDVADKYKFSGKKSDAIITVDSRSFEEFENLNIIIGLLEPNRFDIIHQITSSVKTKQIFLSTDVNPWVYTLIANPEF